MKPCLEAGCPNVVEHGSRCEVHDLGPWGGRGSFKDRYGMSSSEWQRKRIRVIRRDGRACVDCGTTRNLEVDHVVPLSQGGSNDLDNLQTRCRSCHHRKTTADRKVTDG